MEATLCELAGRLNDWDRILVLSHRSPDGDTLGCASALCRALIGLGKQVRFACADPVTPRYAFLFEGLTFPDFEPEHVVTVDVAAPDLLGTLKETWYPRVEMCIDHHATNSMEAPLRYVDSHAAAACEIIYSLLCEMKAQITPEIADCLYAGVSSDTGCFKYQNVTPQTYRIAANLVELGAHGAEINRRFFDTKTRARVEMEKRVYDTLHDYFGGKCACVSITDQMKAEAGAGEDDADGLASLPRQIEGVLVGVTLVEKAGEGYKISLRAIPPVNAAEIAAVFGGGGHAGAAGCKINASLEQAEEQIVAAVGRWLEEHGL